MISPEDLKEITRYRNHEGALSIYIHAAPEISMQEFTTRVTSLRSEVQKAGEAYADEAGGRAFRMAVRKMPEIKKKLHDRFVPEKGQTFCVFLAPGFEKYIELPVRMKQQFIIDTTFYVTPLMTALERYKNYAVLLFDSRQARFFSSRIGRITEEEKLFHEYVVPRFKPSSSPWRILGAGGAADGQFWESPGMPEYNINHRMMETYHRHLKEVSFRLYSHFRYHSFDRLILGSHAEQLADIKKYLHSYIKEKIAGEFISDTKEGIKKIQLKAEDAVKRYETQEERSKIHGFREMISIRAASGIKDTLKELMRGNVRELLLADNLNLRGVVCPEGHYLHEEDDAPEGCPICSARLHKCEYFEDEIAEFAYWQGASIIHITHTRDEFYEKAGAMLRYIDSGKYAAQKTGVTVSG